MSDEHAEFAGLSKPQIDALCNVAFGGRGLGIHRRTLAKLLERNLIVPVTCESSDSLGKFTWTEFDMPIAVHIRFCAFCASVDEGATPA